MAIHYRFMSTKDYNSIPVDGAVISVAVLKRKIFEFNYKSTKKSSSCPSSNGGGGLCFGTDFDFVVVNAQTNEEYVDDSMLIPNNTSVLIRRVPGTRRHKPIDKSTVIVSEKQQPKSSSHSSNSAVSGSSRTCSEITNLDDYSCKSTSGTSPGACIDSHTSAFAGPSGNSATRLSMLGGSCSSVTGLYSMKCRNQDSGLGYASAIPGLEPVQSGKVVANETDEEDRKIKALVNSPALNWQVQGSNGGRGFGRMQQKTPPEGYVCHRCQVPGHFVQHCLTNGDPDYDFKRMRPPTGIPKSILKANSGGSSAFSNVSAAVFQSNDYAFEKEIECPTSKRSWIMNDVPQELLCPLCKQVMSYAVLTAKCCFKSFCDKCIRNHLILSRLKCVCGATEILADYLIPNITVRDTISHILESGSGNSSNESVKSNSFRVENKELAYCSSTMISAKSSEKEQKPSVANVGQDMENKGKLVDSTQMAKKVKIMKPIDLSEGTAGELQNIDTAEEEVQQKVVSSETRKKKRKRSSQDAGAGSYMMPVGSYIYDPYWAGMQAGLEGYTGAMNYGFSPFGMLFQHGR